MRTITVTPTAVATPISTLITTILTAGERGVITKSGHLNVDILLECPTTNSGDINFGGADSQDGFIIAGGSAGFSKLDIANTYLLGNGADTVSVVLPYSN